MRKKRGIPDVWFKMKCALNRPVMNKSVTKHVRIQSTRTHLQIEIDFKCPHSLSQIHRLEDCRGFDVQARGITQVMFTRVCYNLIQRAKRWVRRDRKVQIKDTDNMCNG